MVHYIYIRRPNELFLDIDSPYGRMLFHDGKKIFSELIKSTSIVTSFSSKRTPSHCHVYVILTRIVDAFDSVYLSAKLGSDPYKALHDMARIAFHAPERPERQENPIHLILSPHASLPHNRKKDYICHCQDRHKCKIVYRLNTVGIIPTWWTL